MPKANALSGSLKIIGYMILIFGVITIFDYYNHGVLQVFPVNIVAIVGGVGLVLIGIIAVIISKCLNQLESRVTRLEDRS